MPLNIKDVGHENTSIDEMKTVCQQWTSDSRGRPILAGSLYNRFVLRQISIYVTWLFVRLGIRAHTATLLMTVAGLSGIVLCIPHSLHLTIVGGICFLMFDVLDAVDGEIARWTRSSTTQGLYLDQISHVFVDYPSRGVAALHVYLWSSDELFLALGIAAVGSSIMGRTVREICLRINADTLPEAERIQLQEESARLQSDALIATLGRYIRKILLITFPIVKARLVHIATVIGLLLSYWESPGFLIFLCWFYAVYCTVWLVLEVPYYFCMRVVNVTHVKRVQEYKWPI